MVVVAFVLSISILLGCTLFERDNTRYANQIVARTMDSSITLTMEELLSTTVQNRIKELKDQGTSVEEAFETAMRERIETKALLEYIDKEHWRNAKHAGIEPSNIFDMLEKRALDNTYKAIEGQITEAEEAEKKAVSAEEKTDEENEEDGEAPEPRIYEAATSLFRYGYELDEEGDPILANGQGLHFIDYDPLEGQTFPTRAVVTITTFAQFESLYLEPRADAGARSFYDKALNNYFSVVSDYLKKLGRPSTNRDTLIVSEIERIYQIFLENEKVNFLKNFVFEIEQVRHPNQLNIIQNQVFNYYQDAVKVESDKYATPNQALLSTREKEYLTNMANGSEPVLYHPTITGAKDDAFFYVSHILLPYNADDAAIITAMQASVDANDQIHTQYELDLFKAQAALRIRVQARDEVTGLVKEDDKVFYSPSDVRTDIVKSLSGVTDINKRFDIFKDYMYKFNTDPGIFTGTRQIAYAIPTDEFAGSLNDGLGYDVMVPEFAAESRVLHNAGKKLSEEERPARVASKGVTTTHGVHIIFYHGPATNLEISTDRSSMAQADAIKVLAKTRVRADHNATWFDYVYSKISSNQMDFDTYAENIIRKEIKDVGFRFYKSRYKAEVDLAKKS